MKSPIKEVLKTLIVTVIALLLVLTTACSPTVATINGIKITRAEVDEYVNFILSQDPEGGQYLTDEEIRELEINIIDSLLVVRLLEKYAAENNIIATQEEIDTQMGTIIASYESESAFENDLKEQNVNRKFLEGEIRNQILRNKIFSKATSEVIVTEEQSKEYYDANRETQFTTPERVRASHILSIFPWVEDDSLEESPQGKADARDKIEFVLEQLENGAEFGDMAREYSDDTANSSDGGDLGFINRGQMVEPFEKAAFALDVDEISGIVETEFGYHIIKVFDREVAGIMEFDEVKDNISTYLSELYKLEKWEEFIMGLIEDAEVTYFTDSEGTLSDLSEDSESENEDTAPEEGTGTEEEKLLDDDSLEDFVEGNE